jgi:hypothetical protein
MSMCVVHLQSRLRFRVFRVFPLVEPEKEDWSNFFLWHEGYENKYALSIRPLGMHPDNLLLIYQLSFLSGP